MIDKTYYYRYFRNIKGRILDAGCRTGGLIPLCPEGSIGIDIDKEELEKAKAKGINVKYMDLNKTLDFPDNYFDAVALGNVIEHVKNPLNTLKECKRILKEGGKLVLLTPNTNKNPAFFENLEHLHGFNLETLSELVKNAGFSEMVVKRNYFKFRGLSYLAEIFGYRTIVFFQNLLFSLGIKHKYGMVVIAKKWN